MLYHDNRPRPGQSLTLKFVAKLSLEVEILAALKFLKIPPYCDCWHGGALFSLAQAHRMRNCYSALLYCTIMFLVCCANIMSAVLLYENAVWFHSGCPESVRRVSLRSSLFRFLIAEGDVSRRHGARAKS